MLGNIGPLELIIILAIILVIFGPSRLPDLANALGRSIREFRKAASDVEEAAKATSGSSSRQETPEPNTLRQQSAPNQASATPAHTNGPSGSDQ